MKAFGIFLLLCIGIFFGVGETRGWSLGVASQTPVFAYKTDADVTAVRRVVNAEEIAFSLSGRVNRGSVKVEAYYEKTASFQKGSAGEDAKLLFEQDFSQGQDIRIDHQLLSEGKGNYRINLLFEGASGLFHLTLPKGAEL